MFGQSMVWCEMVCVLCGIIYGVMWCGKVSCSVVLYGVVTCVWPKSGKVWSGMVWCDVVWCCMFGLAILWYGVV